MENEAVLLGEEVIRVKTNTRRMDPAPALFAAQTTITRGASAWTVSAKARRASTRTAIRSTSGSGCCASATSIANGMAKSGYVPNDESFGANTFQVLGSRRKPGCGEDAIVNGMVDMIEASGR